MPSEDKIQWSMRISAAMCDKTLSPGIRLECINDPDFLRRFELCPIYLYQEDFPQAAGADPVGYGLRGFIDAGVLTLIADYELGALNYFLDATQKTLKDLYLSPVIAAIEWEVYEGMMHIKKAAVLRILVSTSKYYATAKKAEMLPLEELTR